jgi:DNA-binding Lrp family transcriptional regulator
MVESCTRKTADWMTQADERILELLKNNGAHPSGAIREMLAEISCQLKYSRPHISRRCKELADHGLLRKNYKNHTPRKAVLRQGT